MTEQEPRIRELEAENARLRDGVGIAVAQLRHAYAHLHAERVRGQREFATGLLGPQIERLEKLMGDPT